MAALLIVPLADVLTSLFNGHTQTSAVEADIATYLEAATPVIEEICGPIVRRNVTIRRNGGKTAVLLPHWFDDIISITENGVDITDYRPDSESGIIHAGLQFRPRRFEAGIRNIVATVTTGYADDEIPANVKLATRELVRFTWQQGRQGTRPGYGEPDADTIDLPSGFAVPRRVMEFCRPHRRYGGFA